ncbi:uncharacterized protein SCHCODRAFT_02612816, partial [Schizophyllum commune H4-8]
MPVYARATTGLSRDNLIIAASCGAVGGLILLAGLVRCIQLARQRARRNKAPLPPPQPLAHHRQRKDTLVAARIASQYTVSVSDASLLAPPSPSRHDSLGPSESGASSDEGSLYQPPMDANDTTLPPHPPFSSGQSSSGHDTPPSPSPSSTYSARPRPRFISHTRPTSTASGSTTFSRTSRAMGPRGSQIQIVLPAPLAPGAYPAELRGSMYSVSDASIADKWVPAPYRHDGVEPSRQSSSSVGSMSTMSHLAPSASHRSTSSTRRSPSRSRSPGPSSLSNSTEASPYSSPSPDLPPVPRVPSMYVRSGTYPPLTVPGEDLRRDDPRRAATLPPGDAGPPQARSQL